MRYPQYDDADDVEYNFGNDDDGPRTPKVRTITFEDEERVQLKSPNKTGGTISLRQLQPEDHDRRPYQGRDAAVNVENHLQSQFERQEKMSLPLKYVESLITGKFEKIDKDVDMQNMGKEKEVQLQSQRQKLEQEMRQNQRFWFNMHIKILRLLTGILAGMGLIQILVITAFNDKTEFLNVYSGICMTISQSFFVLSSLAATFAASLFFTFKDKTSKKQARRDDFLDDFRDYMVVYGIITVILLVAFVLINQTARFALKFFYWNPDNIDENTDIQVFKVLSGIADCLFLVAWLILGCFATEAIIKVDFEPEEWDMIRNGEHVSP